MPLSGTPVPFDLTSMSSKIPPKDCLPPVKNTIEKKNLLAIFI